MSSLHVGICFANWDNEVNVKVVNDIDNQAEQNNKTCVFKVCELDIHCSKFYSPPDFRSLRRRRLESQ